MNVILDNLGPAYRQCMSNYTLTSYDSEHKKPMVESEAMVINFDKVSEIHDEEWAKHNNLRFDKNHKFKSCDALHCSRDKQLTFIEFKNGKPREKDKGKEMGRIGMGEIQSKATASILVATDLGIVEGLRYCQQNVDFILVRNILAQEKMNDHLQRLAKCTPFDSIRWLFRKAYAYTPEEFSEKFISKHTPIE